MALDPARHLTRLGSLDACKARVRDYGLIVDVEWKAKVLYVLSMGHRSAVYRR